MTIESDIPTAEDIDKFYQQVNSFRPRLDDAVAGQFGSATQICCGVEVEPVDLHHNLATMRLRVSDTTEGFTAETEIVATRVNTSSDRIQRVEPVGESNRPVGLYDFGRTNLLELISTLEAANRLIAASQQTA